MGGCKNITGNISSLIQEEFNKAVLSQGIFDTRENLVYARRILGTIAAQPLCVVCV